MSQDQERAAPSDPSLHQRRRVGSKRTPELEATIGARIRALRIAARMSQSALSAAVGISFQQVQKYEMGRDRVAASTLQGIAAALGVHPGVFYDDLPAPTGSTSNTKAAIRAGAILQRVRDPRVLKHLLALAMELAGDDRTDVECTKQVQP